MRESLLVCCGEASGDRLAGLIAAELKSRFALFGLGGKASATAGVEIVVPSEPIAVMGLLDVALCAPRILRAFRAIQRVVEHRRPQAALLVGYTEFNQQLGRWLRKLGTRVVWVGAPQAWAWRPSRFRTLRSSVDRLAVLLPFEEALWKSHGYDVAYVGHPCVEKTRWGGQRTKRLVVLCGSRASEVRRTGLLLLEAAGQWLTREPDWQAVAIEAPGLDKRAKALLRQAASRWNVEVVAADPSEGAAPLLHAYGLAFCVSGTASLEAAVSGALPVIAYRLDALTAAIARRIVQTPHIGLPNLVLGHRAFPELVQEAATVSRVLSEAAILIADSERRTADCLRVRECATVADGKGFGGRVAELF